LNLKQFIQDFKKRKGFSILLSSVYEKLAGFLFVIIATNLLSKSDFGSISYANSLLDFLFPFIGFGIHQSLLRFGAISNSQLKKRQLFQYSFYKGLKYSLLMLVFVIVVAPLVTKNIEKSLTYLLILSLQLLGLFGYELIRIYAQLLNLNNLFVKVTVFKTSLQLVFIFLTTIFFGPIGYVIAISLSPILIVIYFNYYLKLSKKYDSTNEIINRKQFLQYGMYTSFSGVISQLMYATDIILIANILKDELQLAQYKVSNIVPFSFLFIAVAFLKTHIVNIAHHSVENKEYIKNYYINYLKIFSVLSVIIVLFSMLFYQPILFIFGKHYTNDFGLMHIFTFGVIGAILLRIPLGNILAAMGWVKVNTVNSLIIAVLNLILSYVAIEHFGIIGAAYVTSGLLWLSGVFSLIAFIFYLKRN